MPADRTVGPLREAVPGGRSGPGEGVRITDQQRQAFDFDGYFMVDLELSPDEIGELVDVIDEMVRQSRAGRLPDDLAPFSVRNIVCRHAAFLNLLDRPRILSLIVSVLGSRIQLRGSNFDVRPSLPKDDAAALSPTDRFASWHRDEPEGGWPTVGGVVPFMELKVGYFLTDLTAPESGALQLVPGSHRRSMPATAPPESSVVEINVRAGTALIWRTSLLHRVAPNRSGRTRKCIYLAFQHRWLRPSDYMVAPAEVLARCNPTQRQLLGGLAEGMCDLRGPDVEPCSPYWTPRSEDVPLEDLFGEPAFSKANIDIAPDQP